MKAINEKLLKDVAENIKTELSKIKDFQNPRINSSPRAIGDMVQNILGDKMYDCFPKQMLKKFDANFARRAMADMAFFDNNDNYYIVDVKTHNISTSFNMPNLTSVERLSRFYEDDKNTFLVLLVEYVVNNNVLEFVNVRFSPIENLCWNCLTIGALGWGQIQIANSNRINIDYDMSRIDWMIELCDVLDEFYPREISKITDRMDYFSKVRDFWENKKKLSSGI